MDICFSRRPSRILIITDEFLFNFCQMNRKDLRGCNLLVQFSKRDSDGHGGGFGFVAHVNALIPLTLLIVAYLQTTEKFCRRLWGLCLGVIPLISTPFSSNSDFSPHACVLYSNKTPTIFSHYTRHCNKPQSRRSDRGSRRSPDYGMDAWLLLAHM